jgi:dynein heavy chain
MNYQTMADIHKGLAQSGSWGCFDEFNRINIEVLSVVATQVKSILDAALLYSVPANREPQYQSAPPGSPPVVLGTFELNGDIINIIPTCGMFITMNPGYAGRTELPENLKALFRSCAMIRPDLALICENMLMSEGFNNARPLSIKFVTLYELSSALLSPQAHYDWGLRSVKSVLRVAGSLKRGEPEVYEDGILMRALRDFNTPKMPLSDLPIFLRLIQDLFPKYYNLPTKLKESVKRNSIQAAKEAKPALQPDPVFISKVVQLQELMDVRHSVMLLGPGGSGKTTIWRTLAAGHNLGLSPKTKWSTIAEVVDPKAVTSDELYGYMTLAKEW